MSIILSDEQEVAFNKYIERKNIFITGPGGSGKTQLIRQIYRDGNSCGKCIQVCALTGCAAVLLECSAKTIHSWSGVGLASGSIESIIKKIRGNRRSLNAWLKTDVLIIDEVSMMSLKLFDLLDAVGRAIRACHAPFGGIQIIFSGDFYQLPPVGEKEDPDTMRFCFESEDWFNVFPMDCHIQLVKIFRQIGDNVYVDMLNQIRKGAIKRKTAERLSAFVGREPETESGIIVTEIYPIKRRVEHINSMKMNELIGEEKEYLMRFNKPEGGSADTFGSVLDQELKYLKSNIMSNPILKLKVGAQVMCVVNICDEDNEELILCNGSQGKVLKFDEAHGLPVVMFDNGITRTMDYHVWTSENMPDVSVSQIPLILSWAVTIHKSQGATLLHAKIDIGCGVFEAGQTYVALSRVKSLDGLYLTSFDISKIKVNRKVHEFYEMLSAFAVVP